jgi:hypothetical protein
MGVWVVAASLELPRQLYGSPAPFVAMLRDQSFSFLLLPFVLRVVRRETIA